MTEKQKQAKENLEAAIINRILGAFFLGMCIGLILGCILYYCSIQ